jgi:SH3-like domain-containing protein
MMKIFMKQFSFTLFICLLFTVVFSSSVLAVEYGSIKKEKVNIRHGPGKNFDVYYTAFKSYPLKILKREKDWVLVVDYEGEKKGKGWIKSTLLSDRKTIIVKVDKANIRSGPSTEFDEITQVEEGIVLIPVAKQGNWIKIHYDGNLNGNYQGSITGWIYSKLVWPSDPF